MSRIKLTLDEIKNQGYRKADYWLAEFQTLYGVSDRIYPSLIAQQILEKWHKSGSTRTACHCFATCDDGNSLCFVFVSRAGTRIKLSSIFSVVAPFLDVTPDQCAYAVPLDDRKLQEVLEHSSPVQAHQRIITDYERKDLETVMEAVEIHKQKRAEIEANSYGYYHPVENPVNRYNVARMRNMLKAVYNCTLVHITGYKYGRYNRLEEYNVINDITGKTLYHKITLPDLGDTLKYDYKNFDQPDYQKGGTGDGSD